MAFFAAGALLFFISCNNGDNTKETKAVDSTTTKMAPAKAAFTPFKVMMGSLKVKSYYKFENAYMSHRADSMRSAYGIEKYRVGRETGDTNKMIIIEKMNDAAKAKDFTTMLGKGMLQAGGVIGTPSFYYMDVVRNDDSKIDQTDRVLIKHKVKDYNAWLKVFDEGEGAAKRKENGLLDRGLGRGVDDPNMVYIVFAITDMDKAKARMNSPELKKLMMDAGVEGTPEFHFYKLVEMIGTSDDRPIVPGN